MPGNSVNFWQAPAILAPDLAVEQQQLERQRAIADALRAQSLNTDVPQRGSMSWTQGAAKLAQALVANSLQKKADTRQAGINQAYASRMGGLFGAPSAPVSGSAPVGAPSLKGGDLPQPAGAAPPASDAGTGAAPPLSQAPQPDVRPSPPQGGAMSLTGDPQRDMAMYSMNPDEYTKQVIAAHAPVDTAKVVQQAQAALQRGDFATATALMGQVTKNNYIAPVNGRPGSTLRDPLDPSKVIGYDAPNIEGAFPTYGDNGMPTGYQMAPGAAAAMAAKTTATESAKAPYDLVTVVDPTTGAQYQIPKSTITGGSSGATGGGASSPPASGGLNAFYGRGGASAPMGNQSSLGPGQQSAVTTAGRNNANAFNAAIEGGSAARQSMRTIDDLMKAAQGLQTGTGSGAISELKSGANVVLPKAMQFDTRDIAKFDTIKKDAAQLANQLSAAGGTDARLKNAIDGLPNANYSPQAFQHVATLLKGAQAAALARSQAASSWMQQHGPNSFPEFNRQWQSNHDPVLFEHYAQGPQAFAKWSASLSESQRADALRKYRAIKAMGGFQ